MTRTRTFFKARARFIAYGGARGGGKSGAVRKKAAGLAVAGGGLMGLGSAAGGMAYNLSLIHISHAELEALDIDIKIDRSPIDPYSVLSRELSLENALAQQHITFEAVSYTHLDVYKRQTEN